MPSSNGLPIKQLHASSLNVPLYLHVVILLRTFQTLSCPNCCTARVA